MIVECFLDTNILLYAASGTDAEVDKRARAYELIETRQFGISAQVLAEFYVNAIRKVKIPMKPDAALEWMSQLDGRPCISIDADLVKFGIENSERFQVSYWDGAIIAAAQEMGATILYSEDLSHQQQYGSVQVINPFIDLA